ncbi:MAG: ABC transporter permease [Rectinemataceae bacterium]|jgi:spermidine/putrescine transport system permease protein
MAKALKKGTGGLLLTMPSAFMFLALSIVPLCMLVLFSFLKGNIRPDGSIVGYTLGNLRKIFSSPIFPSLMWKSVLIGVFVTAACVVLAYPTAWCIAKVVKPRNRNVLVMLAIIPFFTSQLLLIYSMMVILQAKGILMSALGVLRLADPSSSILYSMPAVVAILVYEYLPYMVLCLYSSLEGIDDNLIYASKSLGAGKVTTFVNVVFPMSTPGLLSGIMLVLVPVTGSFVEPTLAGGPKGMMVGSLINSQFTTVLNMGYGAALSFAFLIVISAIMAIIRSLARLANRRIGGLEA